MIALKRCAEPVPARTNTYELCDCKTKPAIDDCSELFFAASGSYDKTHQLKLGGERMFGEPKEIHRDFIRAAYQQALKSYNEGGLPIGAVMVEHGAIIAAGHNRRVQERDPTAHGEMDCIRKAGRRSRYDGVTLYTTLSPCMMCSGTVLQFGIKQVVVGEDKNFPGNIDFLRAHGVGVVLLDDPDCISLMQRFISERPELWDEDIAGRTHV